ncbi:MAG: hypothetical protein QOH04_3254 [Sphingomonadales bacterium]|nr:hypothetical protein [Sphingomonadales bacterium]MEA3037452.1 hypothetical protein [Sphingomonadales bacterium]
MALEDMLQQLGCVVVGPALGLTSALQLAGAQQLDAAVLDINLGGDRSFAVADVLRARSVPFLFATGYGYSGLEPRFSDAAVIAKPYSLDALAASLTGVFPGPLT